MRQGRRRASPSAHLHRRLLRKAGGAGAVRNAGELVGKLLGAGRILDVPERLVPPRAYAFQAQVFRGERLQKRHAAHAVRQHMKKLRADSVFFIQHAKRLRAAARNLQGPAGHVGLPLYAEAPFGGIQVMPEKALLQRRGKAGEALDGKRQRHLQQLGHNVPVQVRAQAKDRHAVSLHGNGVYFGRVVQGKPENGRPGIEAAEPLRVQPRERLVQRNTRFGIMANRPLKILAHAARLAARQTAVKVQRHKKIRQTLPLVLGQALPVDIERLFRLFLHASILSAILYILRAFFARAAQRLSAGCRRAWLVVY